MLALWEYYWTESDWTGSASISATWATLLLANWFNVGSASATATASATITLAPRSNAGGGHYKYIGPTADFWEVRERYLRRFIEPIAKQTALEKANETAPAVPATVEAPPPGGIPDPTALILLQQALDAALLRARTAQDAAALRDASQRAANLAVDISTLKRQYYNRAIALLLLDVF